MPSNNLYARISRSGARGALLFRHVWGFVRAIYVSLASHIRLSLFINIDRVGDIFHNFIKITRLNGSHFSFSSLLIKIRKSPRHILPLFVLFLSITQARAAFQVCSINRELSPQVGLNTYVDCVNFDLYFELLKLKRNNEAKLLEFSPDARMRFNCMRVNGRLYCWEPDISGTKKGPMIYAHNLYTRALVAPFREG